MRTLLAIFTALALAILPVAKGIAFTVPGVDATEMSAAGSAHECCPAESNGCDENVDSCALMAACVMNCIGFWAAPPSSFSTIEVTLNGLTVLSVSASDALQARVIGPLFRPPRI